ncbi:hypothetical protein LCGC14_1427930 [marine sediment metagenome]|uniref:Uncharacterized protein n=1 Tax=marine sediment metagenome TaxID=412755 RepID=A0A0F9M4Y1_9ZZZZ
MRLLCWLRLRKHEPAWIIRADTRSDIPGTHYVLGCVFCRKALLPHEYQPRPEYLERSDVLEL